MVRALVENQNELREFALAAFNAGGITRGEFRQMIDQPARAADDVYKLALSTVFEPAGRPLGNGEKLTLRKSITGPYIFTDERINDTFIAVDAPNKWTTVEAGEKIYLGDDYFYEGAGSVTRKAPGLDYPKAFPDGDGGAGSRVASPEEYQRQLTAVTNLRDVRKATESKATELISDYLSDFGRRAAQVLEAEKTLVPAGNGNGSMQTKALTQSDIQRLQRLLLQQEMLRIWAR